MHHFSRGKSLGGSRKKKRRKGDRQDSVRIKRGAESVEKQGGSAANIQDIDTLRLDMGGKRKRGVVEQRARKYDAPRMRPTGLRPGQLSSEGPFKRTRASFPPRDSVGACC